MSVRGGISRFCIERPVATTLLAAGVCMLGLFAFPRLPVAPLPEAEFPTIEISANLPGASPETMASAVASPLEVELSAVPGIKEMSSTSGLGRTSITLEFVLTKSIDAAAQEVQSAINAASGRLPADMPNMPTWKKANPGDSPIVVLSVHSDMIPITELTDLIESRLVRQLTQVEGVGEVNVGGSRRPALRISARPQQLAAYGLTMADLRAAVAGASANLPAGAIYGNARTSTIATNGQLFDPAAYRDIVVAYRDGVPVRLGDVGSVENGAENIYARAWPNGKDGLLLIIRRQPGANIIATADRISAAIPRLVAQLPAGIDVQMFNDRTRTIRASLHEVEITLVLTVILVVAIMGLFLRQLSATLIVAGVLTIALIATFGVMFMVGYSLNNLTLVALIIAVGFVVDDAIVVVENIHRHLELGLSRREAAMVGAGEVGFTVISISVSLIAAFIPLLFMGGVIGRLFSEFAMVVAIAVMLSVVVSLTVAPMLAAVFMKAHAKVDPVAAPAKPSWLDRLIASYGRGLTWAIGHPRTTMVGFFTAIALAVYGYVTIPKGFFPVQDTAFIIGSTQAAQDVSFADMEAKHKELEAIVAKEPAVMRFGHLIGAGGGISSLANGRFFIVLKDRSDRDVSVEEFINQMRPKLAQVSGIVLFMRAAQDINLGGIGSRTQYAYVLSSTSSEELGTWAGKLTGELQKQRLLTDVSNDLALGAGVTRIEIDRVAAARFGISVRDIGQMLYDAFGQRQINEYQTETNQYKVVLEIDPQWRGKVESLAFFSLRSPLTGEMVPLSALAKVLPPTTGPQSITHVGMFPSVTISFNLAQGAALGDAVDAIANIQAEVGMPSSITGRFSGSAQAFADSLATQPMLILLALISVYIILGVLYESFVHPLTILSTLPSAGVGAILMLAAFDFDFSIMALIGIVMLIGIVKKNGIMMVDFAIEAQRQGMAPRDAIYQACMVRFRPILMTTLAALLAAIPLMIGLGTGSELRQPLGFAVVGGLLVSQVLTLFTTPVIYLYLERLNKAKPVPYTTRAV